MSIGASGLSLALSPLLPPLRFLSRKGATSALREFEPLVRQTVASARPFARHPSDLDRLEAAVNGFDTASEAHRRSAIALLVAELGRLVDIPNEIADLARLSDPVGKEERVRADSPLPPSTSPPGGHDPPGLPLFEGAPPARPRAAEPTARAAPADDGVLAPVERLRGVGPAVSERLHGKGLVTIRDVLFHFPTRYEDRRTPRLVADAPLGERSVIAGTVARVNEARGRYGRRRLEVFLRDDAGSALLLLWFHYRPSLLEKVRAGARILVSGEVRPGWRGGGKTISHPDVEPLESAGIERADDSFGRVVPVYPEIEGLPPRTYRRIARQAVEQYAATLREELPEELRRRRGLWPLAEAVRESHFPERNAPIAAAAGRPSGEPHRRLAFEELFLVQLGRAMRRRGVKVEPGIAFRGSDESIARIEAEMPWPLTSAQKRAIAEIAADMRKPEPMNRLLQGDVGSGKTAVALCAALVAVEDGYQAALMAPTEILAEQHARSLRALLRERRSVHVELVTGSLGTRERAHADRLVRGGAAHIVVGTHALAEEGTEFHRLGLAVIDEQHRFGVLTRARLMSKGRRPDVLVMTATPIPRTLALTLYGDLDSSVLDELPPGRTPIATRVYRDAARDRAYEVIRKELRAGRQAYVVLPLVEESEKLLDVKAATKERDRLAAEVFQGVPIGLVHGRQSAAERTQAMERFRRGDDRILVATTVIEVGVDVPNATVMLIEHAERFGLSQLHQLRGRVGRGAAKSHCLLVTGTTGAEWGPVARDRLKVMEETTDGFRIAQADLDLRGPGEFLGTRQSGLPELSVAELGRDQKILTEAREEAFALVEADPDLSRPQNAKLREALQARWGGRLSLARVG
ncbi:MAG: ATP-dependent DNA helicase RecG [Myxococcales bacterium]